MLENYKTILNESEFEMYEKKSKFIAVAKPILCEDEAKSFIDEIKKKYWNASHNVFAFQIGERNEIQRFSDDGEPQGTAGIPVLNVLKSTDVKNTLIVVTRYFGGTLLGTGGLTRAYGKAAKEVLFSAKIAHMILYSIFSIKIDYTYSGKLQYKILNYGSIIHDTIYTDIVEYVVLTEFKNTDEFKKGIIEASNGKALIDITDKKYGVWVDGSFKLC